MSRRTAVGIGLAVGVALGFLGREQIRRAPLPFDRAAMVAAMAAELKRQGPSQPQQPSFRLVGQRRVGLVDPRGNDYMAWLEGVDFRRADLRAANLAWATLRRCDFRGAHLEHADLSFATFDARTHWPAGFDPEEHGACRAE